MPTVLPSQPDGRGLRVGLVVARWYPEVVDRLRAGALDTLRAAGVRDEDVLVLEVPGSYELAQAAGWLARDGWQGRPLDALVALGCVVRGETPHFDHVCRATVDGLARVALDTGVPVGLGVITAQTPAQAEARSAPPGGGIGHKGGNKGHEAADAAVRMAHARRQLAGRPAPGVA